MVRDYYTRVENQTNSQFLAGSNLFLPFIVNSWLDFAWEKES